MTRNIVNSSNSRYSDEWYTKYEIVKFIAGLFGPNAFRGKRVLCNCDSNWSNVYKFFKDNYHRLGLAHLTATGISYDGDWRGVRYDYDGADETSTRLEWSGSFDSWECGKIIDSCDIVFTNPPFSRISEYMKIVIEGGKKFVTFMSNTSIVQKYVFEQYKRGTFNIVMTRDVLEKAKNRNLGEYVNAVPSDWFVSPDGSVKRINAIVVSNMEGSYDLERRIMRSVDFVPYDARLHRRYDNFNAINTDTVLSIPDVDCLIGVPVTILTNGTFDRDRLELVSILNHIAVEGVNKFKRILVKLKKYAK
jgi:hypothetical protein